MENAADSQQVMKTNDSQTKVEATTQPNTLLPPESEGQVQAIQTDELTLRNSQMLTAELNINKETIFSDNQATNPDIKIPEQEEHVSSAEYF